MAEPSWEKKEAAKPSWEAEAAATPSWEAEFAGGGVPWTDIGKSAVSGTGTGILSIPGTPGDVQALAKSVAPETSEKVGNFLNNWFMQGVPKEEAAKGFTFPTTKDLQSKVEQWTGPFYEPQTPSGRISHGTFAAVPTAALGGEGLATTGLRALGAGLGGEAGNQVGQLLPESAQPWSKAVGSAIGFLAGPKGLTWNPMTSEQAAATAALSPEMKAASTAGQWTDSPRLRAMEGMSPKGQAAAGRQAETFTNDVLGRAGHQGPLDELQSTIDRAGAERENIRRSNGINPQELHGLQTANAARTYRLMQQLPNASHGEPYADLVKDIYYGPMRTVPGRIQARDTGPLPGTRYNELRDKADAGMTASKGKLNEAFGGMKGDLEKAWENSIGPQTAQEYNTAGQQMRHGITTQESIPYGSAEKNIDPKALAKAADKRSDIPLKELSQNAQKVMTELPKPSGYAPWWMDLASSGATGLMGGAAAHAYGLPGGFVHGLEAMVPGHLAKDALWNMGQRAIGGVAMSPPVQFMAKNQIAVPSALSPKAQAVVNALKMASPEGSE
jgi:hypothetical protein